MMSDAPDDLPPDVVEKIEKAAADAGVKVMIVSPRNIPSNLTQALNRLSLGLLVADALNRLAAPPVAPPCLFYRLPHEPAPGMGQRDLRKLQKQHEGLARAKMRHSHKPHR